MKRSIKLVFSTNTLFLAFSVATSLLSAWALGPKGRGELLVVTMWVFVFSLVGTLGLPYAHRFWSAKSPQWNSQIFSNLIIFTLILSVVLVPLGWYVIPKLIQEQSVEIIFLTQLFLFNIPVLMLSEMLRGQLEGAKLFGWLGASRVLFIAIQAVAYGAFYIVGALDLINALLVIVAAQVLSVGVMLFGVIYKLRPKWSPDITVFRQELHYAIRGYTGILTEYAVWRLDQLMLTAMVASSVLGLYAVAVAVAEITVTLASSVSDVLLPEVASSKNRQKSLLLLSRSLRLALYAQLAALVPLWIASPYLLRYVFGAEFEAAGSVLRVLLFASVVWSAGQILISGLNGFGNPGLSSLARILSAVTTVIGLFLLLPVWGITGAAIASVLGYSVMTSVALFCIVRTQRIGLWRFLKPRASDLTFAEIRSVIRMPFRNPTGSIQESV